MSHMGPETSRSDGAFVGQLADHARRLQHDAREAIARGDYARASALIGDAELLADDVHSLVDDLAHRDAERLIGHAAAETEARTRAPRRPSPPRRSLRVVLGASLAMTLALTEC